MKLAYALVLAVFLVACGGSDDPKPATNDSASSGSTPSATSTTGTPEAKSSTDSSSSNVKVGIPSLAPVADKVRPATVQVLTRASVPFNVTGAPGAGAQGQPVPQGVGTGFIYDKAGYILTNAHVVAGATDTQVTMATGATQQAKIIGIDPRTDLAVLQITGSSLPTATIGDASKLRVGDWTVAVGHALGLPGGPTVTAGVLSATGRHVQEPADDGTAGPFLFDMLQTDAAINPGNSGGPLLNLNGDVIGINTLVAGSAGPGIQAQGIGFAISINAAKTIADQLVKDGRVAHPSLGVSYTPTTAAIAADVGMKDDNGAAVLRVAPGTAAAKAGLRPRDIILKVDGKDVQNESDLPRLIDQKKPGDKVLLTVWRDGKEQPVEVTLDQAAQ